MELIISNQRRNSRGASMSVGRRYAHSHFDLLKKTPQTSKIHMDVFRFSDHQEMVFDIPYFDLHMGSFPREGTLPIQQVFGIFLQISKLNFWILCLSLTSPGILWMKSLQIDFAYCNQRRIHETHTLLKNQSGKQLRTKTASSARNQGVAMALGWSDLHRKHSQILNFHLLSLLSCDVLWIWILEGLVMLTPITVLDHSRGRSGGHGTEAYSCITDEEHRWMCNKTEVLSPFPKRKKYGRRKKERYLITQINPAVTDCNSYSWCDLEGQSLLAFETETNLSSWGCQGKGWSLN